MPDTPWPTFCHRKDVFRKTSAAVFEGRGKRLENLVLVEKGDKTMVDWKATCVFVFGHKGGEIKTEVTHTSGTTVTLIKEDEFDSGKHWVAIDNWPACLAPLKVGKAVAQILEFCPDAFQEETLERWANTKEWVRAHANQHNGEADQHGDGESSLPSAPSAPEGDSPPAPATGAKRKAPPLGKKLRVVARKVT